MSISRASRVAASDAADHELVPSVPKQRCQTVRPRVPAAYWSRGACGAPQPARSRSPYTEPARPSRCRCLSATPVRAAPSPPRARLHSARARVVDDLRYLLGEAVQLCGDSVKESLHVLCGQRRLVFAVHRFGRISRRSWVESLDVTGQHSHGGAVGSRYDTAVQLSRVHEPSPLPRQPHRDYLCLRGHHDLDYPIRILADQCFLGFWLRNRRLLAGQFLVLVVVGFLKAPSLVVLPAEYSAPRFVSAALSRYQPQLCIDLLELPQRSVDGRRCARAVLCGLYQRGVRAADRWPRRSAVESL